MIYQSYETKFTISFTFSIILKVTNENNVNNPFYCKHRDVILDESGNFKPKSDNFQGSYSHFVHLK